MSAELELFVSKWADELLEYPVPNGRWANKGRREFIRALLREAADVVSDLVLPNVKEKLDQYFKHEPAADPVDMLLFCPNCTEQHIDAPHGTWTNPPHKTHECQRCGYRWRPSDVPTNGVASIKTSGSTDQPAQPRSYVGYGG